MTTPTPVTPIDAEDGKVADRLGAAAIDASPALLERLAASGAAVVTDDASRAEAGRDWWPLAIGWAAEGSVPQRPAAVVRPESVEQVAAVLADCNKAGVPVTPAAGRSGVCGGSVPRSVLHKPTVANVRSAVKRKGGGSVREDEE